MTYLINPDRTKPWNNLPELPIEGQYFRDLDIFEQLWESSSAEKSVVGIIT